MNTVNTVNTTNNNQNYHKVTEYVYSIYVYFTERILF